MSGSKSAAAWETIGHVADFLTISRETPGSVDYGQQIVGCEVLRGEDPIHGLEGKLPPAVQEIGKMGLAEAGLRAPGARH